MKIRGAGGGGKGGGGTTRVPSEEADSLQSRAFAQFIDLISEGEIEGLVNGLQSIYLDSTPLQNPDGTFNFSDIELVTRNGTQSQDYIPGFSDVESEQSVGIEVKYTNPVVRTFTNANLDAVRVRISIPQLTYQNPNTGDLGGTVLEYKFELQSSGAGYSEIARDRIDGKTISKYERSYRLPLTGDAPWNIRVSRITPDSTGSNLVNKLYVESVTEIIDGKLTYPNSALVALKIDSSQFSSIPTRGYDMRGIKVRVPINYDPKKRTYTGSWDGNFYVAWTDNPAWIFYDILTSRYGLGDFLAESQVDKWGLYTIAKYCDELVPDGFGGTEPRFTCNCYLQTREEAFNVLQNLASVFRGMLFWIGGTITAIQDAPSDPVHLFTAANVVDGVFTYQGSSLKSRHTVAKVVWNDPDDMYSQKIEYVEDQDGIAKYGVIDTQITAFGCTSRGQANRAGRWLLYSEKLQTETVVFKTGLNGASARPGEIIKIADPARAGSRRGGRILSATTSVLTLDQTLAIDPLSHQISVVLSTGAVEQRQLQSINGSVVTLAAPFSLAPQTHSVWIISSTQIEPQLFKIVSIAESKGGTHDIMAVAHDPSKYAHIEQDLALEPRSITSLSEIPDSPTGLQLTETLYSVAGDIRVKATIGWNVASGATAYIVSWYKDNGNISQSLPLTANEFEILNAEPGEYFFKIIPISALGVRGVASEGHGIVLGKVAPPSNISGFSMLPMGNLAYLSWDLAQDLDVLTGGFVRIRHTSNIVNPVWKDAVDIVPALAGNSTRVQAPLLPGTYMAKFVDSSGSSSNDEAIITTTIPQPMALNVVATLNEHPSFAGAKTKMDFDPAKNGLILQAAQVIDSIPDNIDSWLSVDFAGGVSSEGSYDFESTLDLTQSYTSRVTASLSTEAIDITDSIDQRTDPIDLWQDLDSEFIDDVNAELFVQTTLDNPAGTPTWSEWKRFFVGDYLARAFRFQLRASTQNPAHNIVIRNLSVVVDMPDRVESKSNLNTTAGAYSVTYDQAFAAVPAVGITARNLSTGDYHVLSASTKSGFSITFYNSSASPVARSFDFMAKGYGRQM